MEAHLTKRPINNSAAPPVSKIITSQLTISGKGTPKAPKKPENLSTVSILPIPACHKIKKKIES